MNDTKALTKSYFMHEWWHPSVQKRLRSRDASSRGSRLDSTRLIWLSVIKKFQHYNCTSCILHSECLIFEFVQLRTNIHRTMGPRAVRKEKEFLEKAKKENLEQNMEEVCFEMECKTKSSDEFQDAITFWGQQRSNHSNHENKSQTFAKCTYSRWKIVSLEMIVRYLRVVIGTETIDSALPRYWEVWKRLKCNSRARNA